MKVLLIILLMITIIYFYWYSLLNFENFEGEENGSIPSSKLLFIHIPKTGGSAIQKHSKVKTIGHFQSLEQNYVRNKDYKFTVVRNPYSRLVSAYYYLKNGGSKNSLDLSYQKILENYKTFPDFVENFDKHINEIVHLRPQHEFVTKKGSNKILVDKVLHTESLDEEYKQLCKKFELNCDAIPLTNTSKHKDYKSYYTPELYEKVFKVYQKDFEVFDYSKW